MHGSQEDVFVTLVTKLGMNVKVGAQAATGESKDLKN
jgi:hypothetical protein